MRCHGSDVIKNHELLKLFLKADPSLLIPKLRRLFKDFLFIFEKDFLIDFLKISFLLLFFKRIHWNKINVSLSFPVNINPYQWFLGYSFHLHKTVAENRIWWRKTCPSWNYLYSATEPWFVIFLKLKSKIYLSINVNP